MKDRTSVCIDCSEVVNVPGSEKPFTLAEYKKDLGKAYARITLFICLEKQEVCGWGDTSDSDSDIVITSRSTAEFNQADTVVFEPRNKSAPKHKPENEGKARGHSSTTQHGQIVISDTEDMGPPKTNTDKTTCYSTYTDLYAPCVEEEDEELVAVNMTRETQVVPGETQVVPGESQVVPGETQVVPGETQVVPGESQVVPGESQVVPGESQVVPGETQVVPGESQVVPLRWSQERLRWSQERLRWSHSGGPRRESGGPRRDSGGPRRDSGGPRRELLSLLMKNLKDRPIFDGPDGRRFLVYNANAVREDGYYLAGKMIAVSVVHGGPGPHFLSEDLVRYLAGQPSFKATVHLVTDEEVGKALQEIENAASVDALRDMSMRHSTM
ncbi:G2/M phase-specific E3 ubiquitin-protein ligase [Dissostichus eleginoides]|uniref:G2/M phase-specific E3 ubiquitin-protein ligase n=1 Tax=Dissostichus eleginoides TaxID=100907 RepID=A0AAD9F4I4_DISEL|nr:G2/M phase-specific E3 ubiquitin-protein ligase [Dissostichus eleginoides]